MAVFLLCFSGLSSAVAATFTVSNTNSSGAGSLRQAIVDANDGDTINVNATGTIAWTSEKFIRKQLTINGNGITLDANHNNRFFEINGHYASADLTLSNMALINGNNDDDKFGGAIKVVNYGKLTLNNVHLSGNRAGTKYGAGGAIYLYRHSTVTINNSTFSNNSANYAGGAIASLNQSQIIVNNSTFTGNTASEGGAIDSSSSYRLYINNSTLSGNQAIITTGRTSGRGGAISVGNTDYSEIYSSIFLGNTALADSATNNCDFGPYDGFTSKSAYNLLDESCGLSNGSNHNIVNPALSVGDVLKTAADNGCNVKAGTTCAPTMALVAGGQAINNGGNAEGLTTDQRGNGYPRTRNGQTDIGAYEASVATYTIGGTVSDLDETANGEGNDKLIFNLRLLINRNSNPSATSIPIKKNGTFQFDKTLESGDDYLVYASVHPNIANGYYAHQTCKPQSNIGIVGSANITNIKIICTYNKYKIGGNVSGLNGTVVLQNGSHNKSVSGKGTVNFAFDPVRNGDYTVIVKTHPKGQYCKVTNGGTVKLRGQEINSVKVACSNKFYSIGGQVSGLNGTLKLKNGSETINVTSKSFTFANKVAHNGGYDVSIVGQPAGQKCTISHAKDTVNAANVTNIQVKCSSYKVGRIFADSFEK